MRTSPRSGRSRPLPLMEPYSPEPAAPRCAGFGSGTDGRQAHRGVGKSDELNAQRIARGALPLKEKQLRRPRLSEGIGATLRVLVSARDSMTGERTLAVTALTALVCVNGLDLDPYKALT